MVKEKFFVIATALIGALVILGGCKQKNGETLAADVQDLGGISIIIGTGNRDWDADTYVPQNSYEEKLVAWRKQIQKDYNFTIRQQALGGQEGYWERVVTSIMAGQPLAHILSADGILNEYHQGLLFPLDTIPGVDFDATEPINWNQEIRRYLTFPDGHTYGFIAGYGGNRRNYGLYFNKRILREVGIDPESLYDMQKDGTWTWDVFREICRKVTQDTDNDGQIDIYALHTGGIAYQAMASNDARYIDKDSKGYFIQTMQSPNMFEALQFVRSLMVDGYCYGWSDSNAFKNGEYAFFGEGEGTATGRIDMRDEFGFVMFPKGPRAQDYRASQRDNIWVIPATLSPAEAQKVMQGYILWEQVPPTAAADEWKVVEYPKYRDSRAVDETLVLFRDGKHSLYQNERLIGGHPNDIETRIDKLDRTPAQVIEQVIQGWTDKLVEANRMLFK